MRKALIKYMPTLMKKNELPSAEYLIQQKVCDGLTQAHTIRQIWKVEGLEKAADKLIMMRYIDSGILFENRHGELYRLLGMTKNKRKEQWKKFFKC
jgi:hypothetical protein